MRLKELNASLDNFISILGSSSDMSSNTIYGRYNKASVDLENIKPKSISYGFINCPSNIIFDRQLDTSELISAVSAFEACRKLKDLDISTWDLSKLILANEMFSLTDSLERIENHTL